MKRLPLPDEGKLVTKISPHLSFGETDIHSQEMPIKRLPEFTLIANRGILFTDLRSEPLSPGKESARDSGKIPSLNDKLITDSSPLICESASKRLLEAP